MRTEEQLATENRAKREAGSIPGQLADMERRLKTLETGDPNADSAAGLFRTMNERITAAENMAAANAQALAVVRAEFGDIARNVGGLVTRVTSLEGADIGGDPGDKKTKK